MASNKITSQLVEIGLTTSQAKLYLAGLQSPNSGVTELLKLTGLKRPTLYHALDQLNDQGLVTKIVQKGHDRSENRLIFTFAPPDELKTLVDAQLRNIKSRLSLIDGLLPELKLQTKTGQASSLINYDSLAGLKNLLDIALFCQTPEWRVIIGKSDDSFNFEADIIDYCQIIIKNRRIKIRLLTTFSNSSHLLFKSAQTRLLNVSQSNNFDSSMLIFDNKIATFSGSDSKITASLLASKQIQSGLSLLFDASWQTATPVNSPKLSA